MGSYDAKTVRFRPAAYGLLVKDGQLLMTHSRFTGLWDFPGGGVEAFEWMGEGMAREFFEETGLHVTAPELIHVAEGFIAMFGHPFHSLRYYFACHEDEAYDDHLKHDPGEVSELRWWPLDRPPLDRMHVSDIDALKRLTAKISS